MAIDKVYMGSAFSNLESGVVFVRKVGKRTLRISADVRILFIR